MNKLDNFGPIYVINLEDRADRRDYISKMFKKHGVSDYRFFKAYDGRPLDGQYVMTGGEIGCSMSHLLAIKDWYESSETDFVVIAEDDLSLDNVKYWDWSWDDLLNSIDFTFDIFQISTWALDVGMPEDIKPTKKFRNDHQYLTTCYLISKEGARQILEKTLGSNGEFDLDFNDDDNVADHKLLYGNVKNYYVLPLFSPNVELMSDINSDQKIVRLQKMASEHVSWLWRHNIASIQKIMKNYR